MPTAIPKSEIITEPPTHVAVIMDGNGRWAAARDLPRIAGHKAGAEAVRRTVTAAVKYRVRYLTLYSFSSENWKRPIDEVQDLMGLFRRYLRSEIAELHQNEVRLRFIGERKALGDDIRRLIEEAEQTTANNSVLNLTVAFSYGGRDEIVNATRTIAKRVAAGELRPLDINDEAFGNSLSTAGIPDPDLLIRTSGEKRISNFLLWQLAYAELLFLDLLWPDFTEIDFADAIAEFQRRERRYGATG